MRGNQKSGMRTRSNSEDPALRRRRGQVLLDVELGTEDVDLERWVQHYVTILLREDACETAQGTDSNP